jgi:hypothetical protein
VAPDVARLRDYIQACFKDLCKAAGIKIAPRAAKTRPEKRQSAEEPVAPAEAIQPEPVSSKVA